MEYSLPNSFRFKVFSKEIEYWFTEVLNILHMFKIPAVFLEVVARLPNVPHRMERIESPKMTLLRYY
jgi:hypothetical protein